VDSVNKINSLIVWVVPYGRGNQDDANGRAGSGAQGRSSKTTTQHLNTGPALGSPAGVIHTESLDPADPGVSFHREKKGIEGN